MMNSYLRLSRNRPCVIVLLDSNRLFKMCGSMEYFSSNRDSTGSGSRDVDKDVIEKGATVTVTLSEVGEAVLEKPIYRRLNYNDEQEVLVQFRQGLPQVTVPLPSRREYCRFTLRPVSNTVGDFINMMQQEDRGIDRIAVLTEHGVRIASSNTIESLFQEDFKLVINDREFGVKIPKLEKKKLNKDDIERLSDVRSLVSHLYEALNVQEHQIKKERELMAQLEELKTTIQPLEKKRQALEVVAVRRTTVLTWAGLGLMSVQFGILARLTWWEYSWDIMEPVTYFVTYGTAMAAYAYFVLTKQEYLLPDVRDREHLLTLHKRARKVGLDVNKYNEYKNEIARIESDLARLRDPLELHVPQARSSLHTRQNSLNQNTSALGKIRTMIEKEPFRTNEL
ncbi:mitochondrial calcium uniporter isoform X3 [Lycorma delicatula]|uniref:mitochondrial calcium uniporter isoform X3 n=1 Tax=Lycorma delicatula TaxID=130591 RepID=UPI003F5154F6